MDGVSTEVVRGSPASIDDAASRIQVQGGRYNETTERMTNL